MSDSSVSNAEKISGKAAFFAPEIFTDPAILQGPLMISLSNDLIRESNSRTLHIC
jgi:hypothetical protein